MYIKINRNKSF